MKWGERPKALWELNEGEIMASGELEPIISAIIFSYTWILILPHTNCVALGKSLHLLERAF